MRIFEASQFSRKKSSEYGTEEQHYAVKTIIENVIRERDEALRSYTLEFDGVQLGDLRVEQAVIEAAYEQVEEAFLSAIRQAAKRIRAFHERQKRSSWMDLQPDGSVLGQVVRPLSRVGVYVPGGSAAYPSSVLMNMIPAQVAGVPEIIMVTPPSTAGKAEISPHILVAANEVGVKEIYRVGGAQAIAALAYGTDSIRAVDKVCGPGNIYVALAKRYVYGTVDIDSMAGPSDITVLADETADPRFVAADLLSQAEHDEMAQAILVTDSHDLAERVNEEVERQLATLPRRAIASSSLDQHGAIVVARDLQEGMRIVNAIAPEHLELLVANPLEWLTKVEHAGAVFLGPYSTEPVGDYFAGTNHILPTNGTARFASALSVDDFIKKTSVVSYSKEALLRDAQAIMTLARSEGLEAHARAVQVRLDLR